MAEGSAKPTRGIRTICVPICEEEYLRVVNDAAKLRVVLDRCYNDVPELLFEVMVGAPVTITGTLGFLGLTASDTTLDVLGKPRNTNLGALFMVDLFNKTDSTARRIPHLV